MLDKGGIFGFGILGGGTSRQERTIEDMREEKRKLWRERGYSERLIRMALDLADGWAYSMADTFAPSEIRETVKRHVYPKALNIAENWITRMGEAVKEMIEHERKGTSSWFI